MSSNEPTFDPLDCTEAEAEDIYRGYRDAIARRPPPDVTSLAYDYGRRNGSNDIAGYSSAEQARVARRLAEKQFKMPPPRPAVKEGWGW